MTLRRRGIENALAAMDNAKHRKALPESAPKGKRRTCKMQEACAQCGMPRAREDLKAALRSKLQKRMKEKADPIACRMAQQEAHEAARSPPRYSDLQPIEAVWAIAKGAISP